MSMQRDDEASTPLSLIDPGFNLDECLTIMRIVRIGGMVFAVASRAIAAERLTDEGDYIHQRRVDMMFNV